MSPRRPSPSWMTQSAKPSVPPLRIRRATSAGFVVSSATYSRRRSSRGFFRGASRTSQSGPTRSTTQGCVRPRVAAKPFVKTSMAAVSFTVRGNIPRPCPNRPWLGSIRGMPGRIRVGISGWTYAPWRGVFYPEKWPAKRELEYASRQLGGTLEINGTFYRMQFLPSYRAWYEQTPADFVFAIKGGRYLTHILRLRDAEAPLANFFASGVLYLREKLGPILWQLPPNMSFEEERIATFLELLPHDTQSAALLGARHEPRVTDPYLDVDENRPVRHAMEVRHESFADDRFVKLLRKHNVALCIAETAGKWPLAEDVTADFMYLRLHGAEQIYVSGYSDEQLDDWAKRIRAWTAGGEPEGARRIDGPQPAVAGGRDVYVYFDNTDVKLRAPFDAMALMQRLGIAGENTLPPPPRLETARIELGEKGSEQAVKKVSKKRIEAAKAAPPSKLKVAKKTTSRGSASRRPQSK